MLLSNSKSSLSRGNQTGGRSTCQLNRQQRHRWEIIVKMLRLARNVTRRSKTISGFIRAVKQLTFRWLKGLTPLVLRPSFHISF